MIVVTTPTGRIGHQVLANLLDSAEPIRVVARDPARLPPQARGRVEEVQGSHGDAHVVKAAFAGADAVFWLVPRTPHADSVEAAFVDFTRPACDAFKRHEVKRVVGVSVLGRGTPRAANAGLVTGSLAMDDLIASTGVSYRALTMPSVMDNVLRQVEAIKHQGAFFSPVSADRKLPSCATATSPPSLPGCWSTPPGAGRTASRCSGPRTCPSTTWRRSCPRCWASRCASSRSPPRPSRPC
jgi:uncharacterized protein YbjT (DUF2867 family)